MARAEARERVVEVEQVAGERVRAGVGRLGQPERGIVEAQRARGSAAADAPAAPRRVHEHAPHRAGGCGEEVGPALRRHAGGVGELEVRLVDEVGRGEGVAGALVAEPLPRDSSEFVVDERVERRGVGRRRAVSARHGVDGLPEEERDRLARLHVGLMLFVETTR